MNLQTFLDKKKEIIVDLNGFGMTMVVVDGKVISAYVNRKGYIMQDNKIKEAHNGVYWLRPYFNKTMEAKARELEQLEEKDNG